MEIGSRSFYKSQRNDILKLIALITMLIDHVGYMFFEQIRLFRTIGRIAFPIFAYQLAMGFRHTSNRVRYLGRLVIFSVISYIPYIYFDPNLEKNPLTFSIMFQLLLGFIMLQVLEWGFEQFKLYKTHKNSLNLLTGTLLMVLTAVIAIGPEILQVMYSKFHFSYGAYGMLLMLLFYLFGHKVFPVIVSYILVTFMTTYMWGAEYFVEGVGKPSLRLLIYVKALFERSEEIWSNITTWHDGLKTLEGYFFQARSVMAIPLICFLPRLDVRFKLPTYLAYWFYPIHISILVLIKWWLLKQ